MLLQEQFDDLFTAQLNLHLIATAMSRNVIFMFLEYTRLVQRVIERWEFPNSNFVCKNVISKLFLMQLVWSLCILKHICKHIEFFLLEVSPPNYKRNRSNIFIPKILPNCSR